MILREGWSILSHFFMCKIQLWTIKKGRWTINKSNKVEIKFELYALAYGANLKVCKTINLSKFKIYCIDL
ncbi:hypothetical protein CD29_06695 [Ureibacillus manganicus DSM 26584]|uniref:Uncharacterized protein n=1 Tax=Ureibacillus manganicus DSM 26584 TaxID=1384049 RepID=A0A0A3I9C2_9BACL|nr:hypothetical protein CD29_06695 [Ureibacillus manganicus DSM 26584]